MKRLICSTITSLDGSPASGSSPTASASTSSWSSTAGSAAGLIFARYRTR